MVKEFNDSCGSMLLGNCKCSNYMIRQKSKHFVRHLILPIIGFLVISYVIKGMDTTAIKLGVTWIIIGAIYLVVITKVFKQNSALLDI